MNPSNPDIDDANNGHPNKPVAYSGRSYPFAELGDREFEELVYSIFKLEIDDGKFEGQFDDISLMQGVGERGRDITLFYRGSNAGLIQCKKSKDRVTKPAVAREIVKFVLHYLKDGSLISDPSNFTYYLAVSSDFTGPAIELLGDFNKRIIEETDFEEWTRRVINNNKLLQDLDYIEIEEKLPSILNKISVRKIVSQDLAIKLSQFDVLVKTYFRVKQVVLFDEIRELENRLNERIDKTLLSQALYEGVNDPYLHDITNHNVFSHIEAPPLPKSSEPFVGRVQFIEELNELARRSPVIVITGMPGVGKSALLIHLISESESKETIFYFSFPVQVSSLSDLIHRLAKFIDNLPDANTSLGSIIPSLLKKGQIQGAIDLILHGLANSETFLFFDSLQNVEGDDSIMSLFTQLKNTFRNGNVFIASHNKPGFFTVLDESRDMVRSLELRGLSMQEIQDYFSSRGIVIDEKKADELTRRFDGLPIALDFISILLENSSPDEEWPKLVSTAEGQTIDYLFEMAYERLDDNERSLLNTASIINGPFLLEQLRAVHQVVAPTDDRQAVTIRQLSRKLLLQNFSGDYYSVHDVISKLARTYTDKLDEKRIAIASYIVAELTDDLWANLEALLLYYQAKSYDEAAEVAVPLIDTGLIPYYPDIADFLLAQFDQDLVSAERWNWLLGSKGYLATYRRQYDKANNYYLAMLKSSKEIGDKGAVAMALQRLGILYYQQGDELAEQYYIESLAVKQESKDLAGQAQLYNNLGILYCDQQRYDEAETALKRGRTIHDELDSPEWSKLPIIGNIGILHSEKHEWSKAEEFGQRAYNIASEMGIPDELARSLVNLGTIALKQGHLELAERHYVEALEISEEHALWQTVELVLNGLIQLCVDAEKYEDGIEYGKKAIELQEELESKEGLAKQYFNTGALYLMNQDIMSAVNFHELGIRSLEYVDDKQLIFNYLNNIYLLVQELPDPSSLIATIKALKNRLLRKPLSHFLASIYGLLGEIFLRILKRDRVGLACLCQEVNLLGELDLPEEQFERLINLGIVYEEELLGIGDAINAYNDAIAVLEQNNMLNLQEIALFNRGNCYAELGMWDQAESDLLSVLRFARESGNSKLLNDAGHNIAEVYRRSGEPEKAIELLISSIEFAQNNNDLEAEIFTLNNLGLAYQQMAKHDEAIESFQSAIQLSREYSEKSRESQVLISLGNFYLENGKPEKARDSFVQALLAAREVEDYEWIEGSMLSLAYAHRELSTFDSIVEDFQAVANQAASLEHYESLLGFLILGAEVNFEQGDIELSTDMFEYALMVALILGFERLRQFEGHNEQPELLPHLTEVFVHLRYILDKAVQENKVEKAEALYRTISDRVKSSKETRWYTQYLTDLLEVVGADLSLDAD